MFDLKNYLEERNFEINSNEPLKNHSTMRVGGNCTFMVFPKTVDEFIELVTIFKMQNYNYYVIGNGSNIIFTDKGFDGAIICTKKIKGISRKGNILTAKCGTMIREVSNFALAEEMTGFECLSGIPGTIGGAVYMNAGAYGTEVKDIILSCKVMDKDGNVYTINKKDMNLSYRSTNFKSDGLYILEVSFLLKQGNKEEIENLMKEKDLLRTTKQPVSQRSVGSTFKRPEGHFAGKLIEDAGLKGYNIGGAEVSTLHAGFVINKNNATASDVLELIEYIKKTVYEKFDVKLSLEAIIIGEE